MKKALKLVHSHYEEAHAYVLFNMPQKFKQYRLFGIITFKHEGYYLVLFSVAQHVVYPEEFHNIMSMVIKTCHAMPIKCLAESDSLI